MRTARRTTGLVSTGVALIVGWLTPSGAWPAPAAQPPRLPSEVLHDVVAGRLAQRALSPTEVEQTFGPLLATARTTDLSPAEEVALAQAWFFTFNGPNARPLFERHQHRADRLGRVSRQSLLQMAFAGARDYDAVMAGIADFRRAFAPSPDDLEYTSRMVDNMARYYESAGDQAKATAMILEDVRLLPIDVPYGAFRLLATHMPAFQQTGQGAVAVGLLTKHRDALRARLTAAGATVPPPASAGTVPPASTSPAPPALVHRPGVLHFDLFGAGLLEDDPAMTPDALLLARCVQQVQFLERGRGR